MRTATQKIVRVILFFSTMLPFQAAYAFYDPSLGRWLNRDPVNEPGAQLVRNIQTAEGVTTEMPSHWINRTSDKENLFVFVHNDPINLVDPWGEAPSLGSRPGTSPKGSCPLVTGHTGSAVVIHFFEDNQGCCIFVRTGPNQRAEITHPDGFITRIGANSVFSSCGPSDPCNPLSPPRGGPGTPSSAGGSMGLYGLP